MKIGNDEQALLFPEQRAGEVGRQGHARNIKARAVRNSRLKFQKISARVHNLPRPPIPSLLSPVPRRLPPEVRRTPRHRPPRGRFPASPAPPAATRGRVPGG